jgi:hypothetical protein
MLPVAISGTMYKGNITEENENLVEKYRRKTNKTP